MEFDEAFIKRASQTAAENIICCCRQSGWDALDYAQRMIEATVKRCIESSMKQQPAAE